MNGYISKDGKCFYVIQILDVIAALFGSCSISDIIAAVCFAWHATTLLRVQELLCSLRWFLDDQYDSSVYYLFSSTSSSATTTFVAGP